MPKMNINVSYKNVEEPEEFLNIDGFEPNKHGKFLYLFADCGAGLEWYIPLENVECFGINYKGEEK